MAGGPELVQEAFPEIAPGFRHPASPHGEKPDTKVDPAGFYRSNKGTVVPAGVPDAALTAISGELMLVELQRHTAPQLWP